MLQVTQAVPAKSACSITMTLLHLNHHKYNRDGQCVGKSWDLEV